MGTKNNPGAFDCYAAAHPDEPMFVLLGRDRHAPLLVTLWAWMREIDGEDAAKVAEARDCAAQMRSWRRGPPAVDTPEDTRMLEWLMPVVSGTDDSTATTRTLAIARALVAGLDGREAIAVAMQERP